MDIVDPAVSDYLLTHCTPPDALLRELASETRRVTGAAAGMQVSHDEGELLTMLTWLRPRAWRRARARHARLADCRTRSDRDTLSRDRSEC